MRRFLPALLLAMFLTPSAFGDGIDVLVKSQTIANINPSTAWSQTFWTFESVIPYDSSEFGGFPFQIEASSVTGSPTVIDYLPMFGANGIDCAAIESGLSPLGKSRTVCMSQEGIAHLTDVNGIVSGLPFECMTCTRIVQSDGRADKWMNFLDTGLGNPPPVSATPEPSDLLLLGTGVIGLGFVRKFTFSRKQYSPRKF
jgi:hypothetical protein